MNLQTVRNIVNKRLLQYETIKSKLREEKQHLHKINTYQKHIKKSQQIVQSIAQNIQQQAHKQIAGVVSKCLEAVFDDPYSFKINFEQKRGKTEAKLIFERDGLEIDDPMSASGGGVVDVAAFALQLACLILSKPALRRIMILDEPFKFVHSSQYRENVRKLLEELSREFQIQFLIVTQVNELKIGKVIEL